MEKKFEELLEELNAIVKDLEDGKLSLEESIEKYQRGMELSNLCREKLVKAKETIIKKMPEGSTENE